MRHNPESNDPASKMVHLINSIGCTLLAGIGAGVELGLLEKNTDIGLYCAPYALALIGFVTLVAVSAWDAVHQPSEMNGTELHS
jgi:hypothetical protein